MSHGPPVAHHSSPMDSLVSLVLRPVLHYIPYPAAAAKSLQLCLTLCDPIDGSPPGSPVPLGKNMGVGCHFLLQCMKVKSESEVI